MTVVSYLMVGLGSALGGMTRFGVAGLFARLYGGANVGLSLAFSLLAVWLGYLAAVALNRLRAV